MTAVTTSTSGNERVIATRTRGGVYRASADQNVTTYTVCAGPSFAIEVQLHAEQWTVRDRETGIFGVGATPSEAVADFSQAVREHVDVLQRQEMLSDDLAEQLRYLTARLRPRG